MGNPFAIITERSRRGRDAYKFRIYPTGRDRQILQTALINSVRVFVTSVSFCNFSFIVRHTFSIIFKSGDCAGQVIAGISLLIFYSHVNLELCAGALSSWNINGFSAKFFAITGHKCVSKISVYFLESILPSTGARVLTPSPRHMLCSPKT